MLTTSRSTELAYRAAQPVASPPTNNIVKPTSSATVTQSIGAQVVGPRARGLR